MNPSAHPNPLTPYWISDFVAWVVRYYGFQILVVCVIFLISGWPSHYKIIQMSQMVRYLGFQISLF